MIDFNAQPAVKRAIARLEAAGAVGTGYLVGVDRVATCHHVVKALAKGAAITCHFGDVGEERTAYLLDLDQPSDSALLELREPISAAPLELHEQVPTAFWMHGFPHFTRGTSVSLEGQLTDPDTLDQNGVRAFAMFSKFFAANTTDSIGGFSGSPVLLGGRVIGHMSSVLGSPEARKAPHLGYAFAVRPSGILRLLGRPVQQAATARPPASAGDATIAKTEVFYEIQESTSISEIDAALTRGDAVTDEARLFAAERLIGFGAPREALAILADAASSARRTELEALALSLQGNHSRAIALLRSLPKSAESAGILGGTLKRRWLQTKANLWLQAARDAYSAAYAVDKDPYPGVNVAACSLWLGRPDESRAVATDVASSLVAKPARDAWEEASLAEAYLLSGRFDEARTQYSVAVQAHCDQPRAIAVMRRHARLELPHLGRNLDALDDVFPVPRIAAFTGHRVDDDETRGRFPPSRVAPVAKRLAEALDSAGIRSGYSSAASGGDILFIEALIARGGEPHVFLPFPADEFVKTSVGPLWQSRFERILAKLGNRVVVLSDKKSDDPTEAYRRCNDAIQVAALEEGLLLDENPILLAVISEASTVVPGGTNDMIASWQQRTSGGVVRIDPMSTLEDKS